MEFSVGWVCDRGLSHKRPVNEDRALVRADRGLFVVCDGVGGHNSGEVASQLAIDTIEEALAHEDGGTIEELLENAVRYANRDIFEMAASDPQYFGMGTTVALLHIDRESGRAVVGHAGDSRVYRYDGTLHRETYDHTDLDDAIRSGRVTAQQALLLGKQNTINRALGIEEDVAAEFKTIDVTEGELFLLCSDGVTRHLDDDELEELLGRLSSPEAIAEQIRSICYARGAEDNLTAIVVAAAATETSRTPLEVPIAPRALEPASAALGGPREATRSAASAPLVWILCLVLVAASFIAGRFWSSFTEPAPPPLAPAAAAREAFERGDYASARRGFEALAAGEPGRADYYFWLGRTALKQHDSKRAVEHLEKSVSLDVSSREAHLYLAAALTMEHREKDASEALRRYAELENPSSAQAPSAAPSASNAAGNR